MYDRFRWTLQLPADADLAAVSAVHRVGALSITVSKRATVEPEGRRVAIEKG